MGCCFSNYDNPHKNYYSRTPINQNYNQQYINSNIPMYISQPRNNNLMTGLLGLETGFIIGENSHAIENFVSEDIQDVENLF